MHEFKCVLARDLIEALRALAEHAPEAALIAGGTDLHVAMRAGTRTPRVLISIAKVPELRRVDGDGAAISFGSALTHAEISRHGMLAASRALTKAASAVGSPQVRNVGTAGGNLANASPAGDLYPALLVLGARLTLECLTGSREVDVEAFAKGPGTCCAEPHEIISHVSLPPPAPGLYSNFVKLGLRNAVAISVANAAIAMTAQGGKIEKVRIACGAVAPTAMRMRRAEALLAGERPTDELMKEAGHAAYTECDPITDLRATSEYRRHVVGVLVRRLVESAWRELGLRPPAHGTKEKP
jgi:carbon-monoxide dehydrogenase medium subunit